VSSLKKTNSQPRSNTAEITVSVRTTVFRFTSVGPGGPSFRLLSVERPGYRYPDGGCRAEGFRHRLVSNPR
jgi:hypothetical protein